MSKNYWNEREKKTLNTINSLLDELPDYIGDYETYISDTTSALTRESYIRDIKIFLEYVQEELGLSSIYDVTPDVLSGLSVDFLTSYSKYLSTHNTKGESTTIKDSTKSRRLSATRNLYTYLYNSERIPQNQMSKILTPKLDDEEIIRLEDDEVQDLLSAIAEGKGTESSKMAQKFNEIQALRDITIVSVLLNTGMRVSELVGLDIDDLDLKRFSVRVIRKGHSNYSTLYYNNDLRDLLMHYMDYRNSIKDVKEGSEKALFLSNRKSRINVRSVEHLVKKYTERAEIRKHISPHKLRSTFGTKLYLESGGDIKAVADTLGHKSITTTSRRYVEAAKEVRKANREKVSFKIEE